MRLLILLACLGFLTACQNLTNPIKNRDNEYLQSQVAPIVSVPADMDNTRLGSDYIVAPVDDSAAPNLLPPNLNAHP